MGHMRKGRLARDFRRVVAILSVEQRQAISDQEQIFILKQRTGEAAQETKRLQKRMEMKWEMEETLHSPGLQKAIQRLNAGKLN